MAVVDCEVFINYYYLLLLIPTGGMWCEGISGERYAPPRSKRFMDAMASSAAGNVAYSMNPYPLCL